MFRVKGGLPNGITCNISSPFLNCNDRWLEKEKVIKFRNVKRAWNVSVKLK